MAEEGPGGSGGLSEEVLGARVVATLGCAGGAVGLVLIDKRGQLWHTLRLSEYGAPRAELVRLGGTVGMVSVPVVEVGERAQAVPVERRLSEQLLRLPALAELPAAKPKRGGRSRAEAEPRACAYCGKPVGRDGNKFCDRACWRASRKGKVANWVEAKRARVGDVAPSGELGDAARAAEPLKGAWPASGEAMCARGSHHWLVEALAGGLDRYTCQRPGCGATKEQAEEKARSWAGQRDIAAKRAEALALPRTGGRLDGVG